MVCIAILATMADEFSDGVDRDTYIPTEGVDIKMTEKDPGSHQPSAGGAPDRLPDMLSSIKADGKGEH